MTNENFESIPVKAEISVGQSKNIGVISEKGPFKPLKIIIPKDIAANFLVSDFKVGHNSQFISVGAVPAGLFSSELGSEGFVFDRLPRGGFMTLSVTCQSVAPKMNASTITTAATVAIAGAPLKGTNATISTKKEPYPRNLWGSLKRFFQRVSSSGYDDYKGLSSPTPPPTTIFEATVDGLVAEDGVELYDKPKRTFLGFGSTIIMPGSVANIRLQTMWLFKPTRLYVHEEILKDVVVTHLRVVGREVEGFEDSTRDFSCTSARPGDWITVSVENKSDQARNFQGALVGTLTDRKSP